MSGPASVVARWSVDPVHAEPGAQLSVLGSRGRAVVEMPGNGQPWTSELTSADVTEKKSYELWMPAAAVLAELEAALAGGTPRPDWVDAARAVELAETIDRSLVKARTIELYYEDYTEEGTFKGLMTSIGCGLLILALGLMGLVAIGDHVGLPYARYWPHLLLAGLAVFLVLQLLTLVFRKDDARRPADAATPGEPPPG